jgi:DNA-binding CsgD family transcriptional regulator
MAIIEPMPSVSSPVFVGREAELAWLDHAFELAATHGPATRLIGGEAGIGKTRLVTEFVERLRARDAEILSGDCLQLGDTGLPYAPFVAALRPLLRSLPRERLDALIGPGRDALAHLLPDLGGRDAPSAPDASFASTARQARLFEVVFGVLRRLADQRPVVLVLEDLHWADSSTRDLLRFLVRNARDGRLLLIATYRSDELHRRHALRPFLAEVQRVGSVEVRELDAFDAGEIAAQVTAITGRPAREEVVTALLARSGGNPFFAEELIVGGEAGLALPRSLRDTLEDRVRLATADAQRLLRAAAVGGDRVQHGLLAEVLDLPPGRLHEALREVIEHHLLVPTRPDEVPGYRFRHALLQEVVYEALLPSDRTQLHAAYAAAVEADPQLALGHSAGAGAQIAHHWVLAHDLDRALPAMLRAAREATAAYAFPEAKAFLERALELWPQVSPDRLPRDVDRVEILAEAAEAAAQAGDPRRSIDLVRAALAETDPMHEPMRAGVLHHRLAWYLNESGDWQSGVAALDRAVSLIPIDPPTPQRARVLSDLAHSLMVRGRYGDSLAIAEAALSIGRSVAARVAEARALNALGLDLACRSDFERGLPILREGYDLAVEMGDPLAIFLSAVGYGWALDESARHAEALELAREASERVRLLGAEARFGGQLASKVARALYDLGRWNEALRLIDETLAASPMRYAVRWLLSNRIRILVHRGEIDAARRDIATYDSLGERVIGPDPDLVKLRRAELSIVAGAPTAARGLVREVFDQIAEPELDADARPLLLVGLRAEAVEADLARAAGSAERRRTAARRADELLTAMRAHVRRVNASAWNPAPVIEADLALAEALAARARGETDVELWEAAVAGRRRLGRPHELAAALAELAAAALESGRRDVGAAAVVEAHGIALSLGAKPLREQLEALARRATIQLPGVPSADDTAERLGLTRREREVLALLADGRSNRQIGEMLFMAESTAGVHVSNILGKLGVSRRTEAAALAHRLGLFGLF